MTESDLRSTLNLPEDGLPHEGQPLPGGAAPAGEVEGPGPLRAGPGRPEGTPELRPPRRAALRQRAHPPRHRAQQDPEGRDRAQPVGRGERRPVPARLGLPRPADRAEGGPGPRGEEARDVAAGLPSGLPSVRREVRGHPARGVREARGPRGVAGPLPDDVPVLPGDDRPPARHLRREGPRLQGQEVGPLVHLLPDRARRGRGRVRREPRQPPGRRAFPARRGGSRPAGPVAPGARRQAGLRRHLDHDSLDAPRQPRPRRPPRRRVRLLPARGHGRRPGDREGAARGLRGALAREGQPRRRPAGSRRAARRGQGRPSRAPALPPPLDRPRLPRPPGRLRHPRHRHRDRPHRPRPRVGRLPHRSPLRARRLLSRGRGGAIPARGRALRRAEGLRGEPGHRGVPARDGRPPAVGPGHPLVPDLLALQEPDHLPRHRAVVHRPRRGNSPPCASRRWTRSRSRSGCPPGARSASGT